MLANKRYLRLRERLWELEVEFVPSPARLRRLRTELVETRAEFKSYVLRSLTRQRVLEKELARLKYPSLYRADLDVVAETIHRGDTLSESADSISVVITNYNYGRYLPEAIEGVLAQTHQRVEIIVVDDASTDGSTEVLERLLGGVDAVPSNRLLLKHNVGQATARNLAIGMAQGEFVFILDADNRLLPNCLELHVRAARNSDADAVYATIRTFGPAVSVEEFLSDAPFNAGRLSTRNYIDAMALFRRSTLIAAGLYSAEPILYGWEDYELWLRFAAQGRKVEFVPTVLSEYRVHGMNFISLASLDVRGARAYLRTKYPDISSGSATERLTEGTGP
jgi:glycosyltransferase involved in cell wall biosynthesis